MDSTPRYKNKSTRSRPRIFLG